jgi:hypothetical protein
MKNPVTSFFVGVFVGGVIATVAASIAKSMNKTNTKEVIAPSKDSMVQPIPNH